MLSPTAVEEFKQLYLKEFGIQLTDAQALELGMQLIRLIKAVYGPNLPKKWTSRRVLPTMQEVR